MSDCDICGVSDAVHEPVLCADCCCDRVHRLTVDLAALSIAQVADLADRFGVSSNDVIRLAIAADRTMR